LPKYRLIQHLLLFGLLLLMHVRPAAQLGDYHLQLFDFTYGIKPGNITAMCKDQQGFLWVLYTRSAQRFDGKEVMSFAFPKGVTNITCDDAGRVWVNSATEIFLYNTLTLEFNTVPIKTRNADCTLGPVFSIPGNQTWVITTKCFLEYDTRSNSFVDLEQEIPIRPNYHAPTLSAVGPVLFFGGGTQVYKYNVHTNEVDSLPNTSMRRLYPLTQDSILVSSWNLKSYWYDFANDSVAEAVLHDTLRSGPNTPWSVRSVAKMGPDHYIIASQEGLLFYHMSLKAMLRIQLLYKGNIIQTNDFTNNILIDKDKYAWVATVDGVGRFSLQGQYFGLWRHKHFYDDLPYGADNVRQITEGDDEVLWIATGNGFASWDQKSNEHKHKLYEPKFGSDSQLAFPSVRGIAWDGKYVILGPSDLGMWLFDPKREAYRRPTYASAAVKAASERDFIDHLGQLRSGDIIVTGRDHLYKLDGKTYTLSFLDMPFASENNNFVFQNKDGKVWITTTKGLYLLSESLEYLDKADLGNDGGYAIAGCPRIDGSLIFSTQTHVYTAHYDNDNIVVAPFAPLADTLGVNIILEDHQKMIWATSDNGLYRYDPTSGRLNQFDYTDNLQGFGFNGNSWYISKRGVLFLGGTNGINYFLPEKIQVSKTNLNLFIQRVRGGIGDSIIYPLDQVAEIPWGQRSLEVHYVSPYFNNSEKLRYRYRLEGMDNQWKYVGNTHVLRFPSFSPGEYTLHLEASVNNIDWTPARNSFSFVVLPPFWQTWWFALLSIAVVVSILWAFAHSRNRRVAEKQEELEAEQAINYFSTRMVEDQSIEALLWDITKHAIGRLHFEDCIIYLLDEKRGILYQAAAYGPKNPGTQQILSPIEIAVGEGIVGTVAKTGVAEIIDDTTADPRYIVDDAHRNSEIAVPIMSGGVVLGVIDSEHSKKRFFTQRHLSILTTIASLCAAKIVKARAEAERLATERILMETKQQMADIEMQALRAQMNPHFIFNCLNSINRYIVKSDQATASLYLTRFAKLIRLILDNSNSKTVTLTNELEALRLYIEMESIRFEKQFNYCICIGPDVRPDHIYVPPLIIQPYVENAIWHGLLHKESAGELRVDITLAHENLLECIIQDNGIGREKAKELKSKSASTTKSLGMKLTESRLALLNKHSQWDAVVQIEDLVDPEGSPAGTRVSIRIPIDV
jgi:putative methionine-R-sulfoxide reductase with GAF domain/ligand-binding sensor domain-containing protein